MESNLGGLILALVTLPFFHKYFFTLPPWPVFSPPPPPPPPPLPRLVTAALTKITVAFSDMIKRSL